MTTLHQVLATEGLWLLVLGVSLAGLVRGFSGFGTAMVYLPFAAQVLPPVWTVITLLIIDVIGPTPAIPGALRHAQFTDMRRLLTGLVLGLPLGLWALFTFDPTPFRYAVSLVTGTALLLMISGLRWQRPVPAPMLYGIGAGAGVLGGAVALPGPPVILFYMARPLPVATIRATILLFLVAYDLITTTAFALRGALDWQPVLTGLLILPAYVVAVAVGTHIFDPDKDLVYRRVAYAIIAASVLAGLPLWD